MPTQFSTVQVYVDVAYIREDLKGLGIDPWFGPTELHRPLNNLRIDGHNLAIRRTIFYDAIDDESPTVSEHKTYLESLRQLPDTQVWLGTVRGTGPGRQKQVDVRLSGDMEEAARSGRVEYVALAAGDADFIPAVQKIQAIGPKVLVLGFPRSISFDLTGQCDRFIPLPENTDRVWAVR